MPPEIVIKEEFRKYAVEIDRAVRRALVNSAADGVGAARSWPSKHGYNIGAIQHTIQADRPQQSRKGLIIAIGSADFRALFFELGTLQRRRRKTKRASTRHGLGVWPGYFLSAGKRTGQRSLPRHMTRQIGKIGNLVK
jgi:hypothetical protein